VKGVICLIERERLDLRSNREVCRQLQQVEDILSRAVGDAHDGPFLVEQAVVKLRDRSHGDAGESDGSAFPEDPERLKDQPSDGREDDRAVEPTWGIVFCAACPAGTQLAREGAMLLAPGKDEDLASPVDGDLDGDVG
jgi:hypothetical protein